MRDEWAENLLKRFEGRKELGKKELYEKHFKSQNLDEKEVMECFEEIELGYNIPAGILRPEDNLTKLTNRVTTNNPLKWFWWLGKNEFSDDSLIEELGIRMKKHGTFSEWKVIETFDDLVQAWCGQKPNK
jgi:hypothetical protein